MKNVNVYLVNGENMIDFYVNKDQAQTAKNLLALGLYQVKVVEGDFEGDVEDIAEEMFDLTNNPYRQDERVQKYGRGRSLSVGDIVEVGGKKVVCASIGWTALN